MGNTVYKTWELVGPQHIQMQQLTLDNLCAKINGSTTPVGLGIDGSSDTTGLAFMNQAGGLIATGGFTKLNKKEDFVEYKIRLKTELLYIFTHCTDKLKYIWYEEPFVGFAQAAEVLMAIRTTVKEIILENKPKFDHFVYKEVNNKRWKKIFLEKHGSRLPSGGSEMEKKAIAAILGPRLVYDNLNNLKCCVVQDEMDAAGLVYAGWYGVSEGIDLASKKAVHKFKFNVSFEIYDATPDEVEQDVYLSLTDVAKEFKIPSRVLDNGITIKVLSGRKMFDNIVYETMGEDDKLLVFIYDAAKYANILFQYGAAQGIASQLNAFGENQTMVAYIWRKSRKQ